MAPAILETAIYMRDLDAAEAFYGGLIGLDIITRKGDRHVFFRCDNSVLLVFNPDETVKESRGGVPGHGTTGRGHFAFAATVEEQAEWERKLNAAGCPTEHVEHWPNDTRSVYFSDPAGNSIEFAEAGLWGFDAAA